MSMNQIDAEYMAQAASDAENLADELAADAATLISNVEPMAQGFVGSAGTAFQNIKETIRVNMIQIDEALTATAEGIRSTGVNMTTSDEDANSSLASAFEGGDVDSALSALTSGQS